MPFEKGHSSNGGRPKGSKNKKILITYKKKKWYTAFRLNSYNINDVEHRLNNDLPMDDLSENMDRKYNRGKQRRKSGGE